jgi:PAS domain-containing protein
MNFKFKQIRSRFILQIAVFLVYIAALSGILLFTLNLLKPFNSVENQLQSINTNLIKSYGDYTDFRLTVDEDNQFFYDGTNKYIDEFNYRLGEIQDTLTEMYRKKYIDKMLTKEDLKDTVNNTLQNYRITFNSLYLAIKERGIREVGSISDLRATSDDLLSSIANLVDSTLYLIAVELKDLESAYLFSHYQSAYYGTLVQLEIITSHPAMSELDFEQADQINNLANKYKTELEALKIVFDRISSDNDENGLIQEYNNAYLLADNVFTYFGQRIVKIVGKRKTLIVILGVFAALIVSLFYIFIILQFLIKIRSPLINTVNFIHNLAKGKLANQELPAEAPYEFSAINEDLNKLNEAWKEKKTFVDGMLKQKFKADISLQGKNDTFGKTLLALKENMRKAREEQLQHAKENELRRYHNEGVAKFAGVLRMASVDLTKLADGFIREIVKYLEAIQGGLFLVDEEDESKLDLIAAFAYDRKKYISKSIGIGEGLVGTCAIEKKTINLTEIPEEYIEITSGLGDAPPNNLLLLPIMQEGTLLGVVEIASLKEFSSHQIELGESIASNLAATILTTRVNTRTAQLLEKSQQQAAEMAEQEEEMRQNMEELKATQEESIRREEELEGILNAMDQSFYVLEYDIEGIITRVNKKVLYFLNLDSDKVIGKSHSQVFGKGSKADSLLFAGILEGKVVELVEKVKIDKKPIELKNTFSPIRSKSGETLRILNIMTTNF